MRDWPVRALRSHHPQHFDHAQISKITHRRVAFTLFSLGELFGSAARKNNQVRTTAVCNELKIPRSELRRNGGQQQTRMLCPAAGVAPWGISEAHDRHITMWQLTAAMTAIHEPVQPACPTATMTATIRRGPASSGVPSRTAPSSPSGGGRISPRGLHGDQENRTP